MLDRVQGLAEHSDAVGELAEATGRRLGLEPGTLEDLALAAHLHDVGKLAIPEPILVKEGPLTPAEWRIMRTHPAAGAEILRVVPELVMVAEIVRSAHERWDGRGYPDGLRGEEIPLASRIILACDAWDAMVSDRPYRRALRPEAAASELRAHAGTQFDPHVVDALLAELGQRPVKAA